MNDMPSNEKEHQDDYKYWAFISYSHADEEWATWLHRHLERYRIPKQVAARSNTHRLFPVFRDRDELPGAAELGDKIHEALSRSRFLIVICSPRSAVSRWVNEEIKTFKSQGGDGRILALIVDGEPNASDQPESGLLEAFPKALRYQMNSDGEQTDQRSEPLAADARKSGDGRSLAALKLIAGILNVGFDELRQRDRQRIRRDRSSLIGSAMFAILILFLLLADAGLALPGGEAVRTLLDRHQLSIMRPVHSEAEVQREAAAIRRRLVEAFWKGRDQHGRIGSKMVGPKPEDFEAWSGSQAICGLLRAPETTRERARAFLVSIDFLFTGEHLIRDKKGVPYGWLGHPDYITTEAEPALWTTAAVARALGRPDLLTQAERKLYLNRLNLVQRSCELYRPDDTGGWHMFPNQKKHEQYSTYATALALLALLETRTAKLPWLENETKRDAHLESTAKWLIGHYRNHDGVDGWSGTVEPDDPNCDGLTLQIYAELLRAEADAAVQIPGTMLEQIPRHLASLTGRILSYPVQGSEFRILFTDHRGGPQMGSETINFLWHPWAIECAHRWLLRAEKRDVPAEQVVRVRRALGHLVVDLGEEAVRKVSSGWTFEASETLYGLGQIPQP